MVDKTIEWIKGELANTRSQSGGIPLMGGEGANLPAAELGRIARSRRPFDPTSARLLASSVHHNSLPDLSLKRTKKRAKVNRDTSPRPSTLPSIHPSSTLSLPFQDALLGLPHHPVLQITHPP
jgi:hypothetical protein